MPKNNDRNIIHAKGGILNDVAQRVKLIVRLLMDRRVSPFLKLLPVGTLVYFLFPDIVPGPVDDVAIIWLGAYLFVELCPPEVVQEHMDALQQVVEGEWRDAPPEDALTKDETIIEADYWEKEDQD